ncbi:MAG: tetratricopeptide repeat protein [Lysobacterales bacterium]
MKLLAELKRRNVFRMAGLYLVGAWLIIQIAETLLPAFDVPGWVLRAVIILLAIGFIPALIFSWVFELTPEGVKRDVEVDHSSGAAVHSARKLDIAIIVLLLGIGVLMLWRPVPETAPPSSVEDSGKPDVVPESAEMSAKASVAVLPFLNMSPDADNEYFADGIAEELLNVLSRIDGLKVASRTSSFTFKGKDTPIPEIARLLGVRHVLEGSVRKQGQRVRITAQLINAGSDGHLWSQTYDRELTDIFEIQQEIAESIAAELGGLLGTKRLSVAAPTADLGAYERFLRGRARFHRRAELPEALADLEYAATQDPDFAEAWIYLAAVNFVASSYAPELPASQTRADARTAIARAAALSPDHPMVLAIQGQLHTKDADQVQAIELLERAAALSTNDSTPVLWLGQKLFEAGYVDEAIDVLERAVLMDPLVGINNGVLAQAYFSAGRSAQGEVSARAGAANGWNQGFWVQLVELGASGLHQQAAELARSQLLSQPASPDLTEAQRSAWLVALADPAKSADYLALRNVQGPAEDLIPLGMGERVFDWFFEARASTLEVALAGWMLRAMWLPSTRHLREDPRFWTVAGMYGLIELWEQRGYPPGCRRVNAPDGDHLDCGGGKP